MPELLIWRLDPQGGELRMVVRWRIMLRGAAERGGVLMGTRNFSLALMAPCSSKRTGYLGGGRRTPTV